MFATATGTTGQAHEKTVRLRPGDLPVKPLPTTTIDHDATTRLRSAEQLLTPNAGATAGTDTKTVRLRPAVRPLKSLPPVTSGFDGQTVRQRIGNVANTVRQRYADLSTKQAPLHKWDIARIALILGLAAMPILGISVDVSGLVSQGTTSIVVIVLTAVYATLVVFAPHRIDIIVGRGLISGMVACIVYDGARLFAVHVLGLMGDFIPVMGSFVTGEPDTTGSAAVGYVWRYIGDAGGLGVAFFVFAFALGIDRWKNVYAVLASVAFAVFPTWAGLMATVALLPRGEEMMFPLNPATVTITFIGHVIFGFVLGFAFLKRPRGQAHREWPWTPILETAPVRRLRGKSS